MIGLLPLVSWLLISGTLVFVFFVVSLTVAVLATRGRFRQFLRSGKDRRNSDAVQAQILRQKQVFVLRLLGLKAFGVIFPFLLLTYTAGALHRALETQVIMGQANLGLWACWVTEHLFASQIYLGLSSLAWIFYLVFGWIFRRRVLSLEELEVAVEH